ncbi:hypothetical protein C0J52_24319 [Blattella germanica]|nr:hypothetical protein C0J52_24319 [Blattella germanica]
MKPLSMFVGKSQTQQPKWAYEKTHEVSDWERDTPKVNVWLHMANAKLYGPFFFAERSITGNIYL